MSASRHPTAERTAWSAGVWTLTRDDFFPQCARCGEGLVLEFDWPHVMCARCRPSEDSDADEEQCQWCGRVLERAWPHVLCEGCSADPGPPPSFPAAATVLCVDCKHVSEDGDPCPRCWNENMINHHCIRCCRAFHNEDVPELFARPPLGTCVAPEAAASEALTVVRSELTPCARLAPEPIAAGSPQAVVCSVALPPEALSPHGIDAVLPPGPLPTQSAPSVASDAVGTAAAVAGARLPGHSSGSGRLVEF